MQQGIFNFESDAEAALSFYQENGYFIAPGILKPQECDAIISDGRDLLKVKQNNARPLMQPHRESDVFRNTMRNEKIVGIVNTLIGEPVDGLQSEFFIHAPGTPGFAPHQDNYFVRAPADSFVSAWAALVDINPENGGLYIYPGSHRSGFFPVKETGDAVVSDQDPNAFVRSAIVPDQYKATDSIVERGSVIFIHGFVAHGSYENHSNHCRYSLLNTYIRHGSTFRTGRYANREAVAL